MTVDDLPGAPGDHRNPETEFSDDGGHLIDGVIVLARIAGIVDQSVDRPLLQREFGWGQVSPLQMETARTAKVSGRGGTESKNPPQGRVR